MRSRMPPWRSRSRGHVTSGESSSCRSTEGRSPSSVNQNILLATGGRKVTAGEAQVARSPRRRWLRRLAATVAVLLVGVLAVYGWAWSSVGRSTVARALWWGDADVGDQYRFPSRLIPAGDDPSPLPAGGETFVPPAPRGVDGAGGSFDDFLGKTGTRAFLVLQHDRLVYERYFDGSDRQTLQTSFSVAKSFVSTLVGIAIDEGFIGSIKDP